MSIMPLPNISAAPGADVSLVGSVVAVAARLDHGFSKLTQGSILMVERHGVEGDAHAGPHVRHRHLAKSQPRLPNLRQVHLLPCGLFEEVRRAGFDIGPGSLGENVTTAGLDLTRLPLGTQLHLGETAVIELTGLRTPCRLIDRFQQGLKRQMIETTRPPRFKCGVLGIVTANGEVKAGATIRAVLPSNPWRILPAL